MKNQNRLMVVLLLGFSLAIPIFSQAAQAGFKRDFSGLYVFGDSLSDPGNAYAVSGVTVGENYEPIPAAPYDTRRFSNGRTWAEILAGELHTWRGGLPAFRSSFFTNYAFGGARALGGTSPDFGTQVGVFLDSTRGRAPLDALYVVQFGGNDIRAALEAAQTGGNPIDVIVASVGAIVSNINLLRSAGARSFLVANAPNLGRTPVINAIGAAVPAEQLSIAYNQVLDGALASLAASGIEIYRLDFFAFVNAATEMPQGFGFADAGSPCLPVFIPAGEVCTDPDQHLFWDGIHPTRAAHRLVGNIAVNLLSVNR